MAEIKDFYKFSEKLLSPTFQAGPVDLDLEQDENRLDDVLRLLMGDYTGVKLPVVFKQSYGKRLEDVIRTGYAVLFLISDRMRSVLEENNLTGWKTFPVQVLDKKGGEVKGYHGLSIIGRCGKIDYSKCEIVQKRRIPNGPLVNFYRGLYVGLDKWDGSDFFLPEKYYGTIVTKEAAGVLRRSKLTNIELENLAEFETDEFTVRLNVKKNVAEI